MQKHAAKKTNTELTQSITRGAKPGAKSAAPVAKLATKPSAKVVDKFEAKWLITPAPKAPAKPIAKTPAKPAVKAPAKPAPKPAPKAAVKETPKAVVAPAKTPPKAEAKAAAKPAEKAAAKPAAKPAEKAPAKPAGKPSAKASAKTAVKAPAKAPVKVAAKAPEKAPPVPPAPQSLPALTALEEAFGDDSSADAKNAYVHFLPLAQNFATLVPFRGADPAIAQANVATSVSALTAERGFINTHLPQLSFSNLTSLPELALAMRYAIHLAEGAPSAGEIHAGIHASAALRGTLLAIADGLVREGFVPAQEVAAIRKGTGASDAAGDCVALAELFEKYERKIPSKSSHTVDLLKAARHVNSHLLGSLKPARAKDAGKAKSSAALEIRDRLWSLLVARYSEARKMAYYIWGDDFDAHVPSLLSTRHHANAKKSSNGAATSTKSKDAGAHSTKH